MTRRPTPPLASSEDYREYSQHQVTVHERDAVDTGLLDANGTPIFRYPDPVGFRLEPR